MSLLIKPVQIIPRYKLLIERLNSEAEEYALAQSRAENSSSDPSALPVDGGAKELVSGSGLVGGPLLVGGDSENASNVSPLATNCSTSPPTYPDAEYISLAAHTIRDILNDMNESLKRKEKLMRVAEIQALFLPAQVRILFLFHFHFAPL